MRPQLMDIIVLLIWLSLISIHSSHGRASTAGQQSETKGSSSTKCSPDRSSDPHSLCWPPSPTSNRSPDGSDGSPPSSHSPPPPPSKGERIDDNSSKPPVGKTPPSNKEKKQPFGKKLGICFLGIAGALQVVVVAFLSFKRRQIPRIMEKNGTQLGG